jgi:hypothetical protein
MCVLGGVEQVMGAALKTLVLIGSAVEATDFIVAVVGVVILLIGVALLIRKAGEAHSAEFSGWGMTIKVKSLGLIACVVGLGLAIYFGQAFAARIDDPGARCTGPSPNYPASPDTAIQQPASHTACISSGDHGAFFGGQLTLFLGENHKLEVHGASVAVLVRHRVQGRIPMSIERRASCHHLPTPENGDELEIVLSERPPEQTFVFRVYVYSVGPRKVAVVASREAAIVQRVGTSRQGCFLNGRAV